MYNNLGGYLSTLQATRMIFWCFFGVLQIRCRRPFCHKRSSSSSVIISAFFAPFPSLWSLFISVSSEDLNSARVASLNMSICAFPLHRKCRMSPAVMWCRVFGRYSLPSFFLTSRINLVSQWFKLWSDRESMLPICSLLILHRLVLHCSQRFTQYLISWRVLFGIPSSRCVWTCMSVLG